MSEKLLKVLLSELTTVRLICRRKDCGGVLEAPIEHLGKLGFRECPVCEQKFSGPTEPEKDKIRLLGKAIEEVSRLKKMFEIEFVLPDDKN